MKNNKYSYNLLEAFEDLNREESLKESRSVADIEAEIASLQQELERAKAAEKKASYKGNIPKVVYIWDIYLDPADKGSWTSAELYNGKWDGTVFETANEALDAGYSHLMELETEGELEGDLDNYSISTVSVLIKDVHPDTLSFSNLEYLI